MTDVSLVFKHSIKMNTAIIKMLVFLSGLYFSHVAFAQEIIYNGNFSSGFNYWYLGGTGQYCNSQFVPNGGGNTLKIDVYQKPVNFWDVQLLQDYQAGQAKEDVLLLRFSLKNPDNPVRVAIQDNGSPWHKYNWVDIQPADVQTNYRIVFDGSLYEWNAGDLQLCFFMGFETGTIELSDISYVNLGPGIHIDSLNPTMIFNPFFQNQPITNSWQKPAQERIELLRKSPTTFICKDGDGNLLKDVEIHLAQLRKDFPFGSAVAASLFGGSDFNPEYVAKAGEIFNFVTIENHLKWNFYQWAHPYVDNVFNWADTNGIPVHGHCLFWPSYLHCPDWIEGLPPQETYDSVISHVEQYAHEYRGKVVHWDVLNEAVTNTEIWEHTGIQVLADAYMAARANDSAVFLMYNDYNLLINDPEKQDEVMLLVNQLREMGADIQGLGVQGHITMSTLVTPENALKNLDKLSQLGLPIWITELDISVEEYVEFQAEYFRDLLTALYSHPSVEGIIQWGFWEGWHWRPEAALYNLDWSPRPNGLVFEELMTKTWVTDTLIFTNKNGIANNRCFHGELAVFANYDGKFSFDTIHIKKGLTDTLEIVFDFDTFYVDHQTGNDDNPGTENQPWKTIQKAFNSATPGSTVLIKQGIYNEELTANVSGNETNGYLTFRNFEDDEVIVDGTGLSDKLLLNISNKKFLKVEGLEFRNAIGNWAIGILIADGSENIVVKDCKIYDIHFSDNPQSPVNPNTNSQPLAIYGNHPEIACKNIFISGNEVYNCRTGYSEGISISGNVDGFEILENHVHDLKNIGIDAAGHWGACPNPAFDQARNGVIRGNRVHHCASEYAAAAGIYVDGGSNIIIENNICHHNQFGIEAGCENTGKSASQITIRNNLVFKNGICGIAFGGYDYPAGSGRVTHSSISGNTCYYNDTTNTWTGELYLSYSENCLLENNIFSSNQNNFLVQCEGEPQNLTLDYNLWFCPDGADWAQFYWNGEDIEGFSVYQIYTSHDQHSSFGNPQFLNPQNDEMGFYPASNSPAINAGNPLFVPTENEKDFFWQSRKNGAAVDAGCYEYYGELASQTINAPSGWGSLSSFLRPFNPVTEVMFSTVCDELIILKNKDKAYFPSSNINTLNYWDITTGYALKMADTTQVTMSGYKLANIEIQLREGWNWLPVLSDSPVLISDLIDGITEKVTAVHDIAGTRVYWPAMQINTLVQLMPGKAYFILVNEDCKVGF